MVSFCYLEQIYHFANQQRSQRDEALTQDATCFTIDSEEFSCLDIADIYLSG